MPACLRAAGRRAGGQQSSRATEATCLPRLDAHRRRVFCILTHGVLHRGSLFLRRLRTRVHTRTLSVTPNPNTPTPEGSSSCSHCPA